MNWCPALGTVLANEEVIDGRSERGGHPVIRKPMRQWMLKITAYADRLLEDLDLVEWPESIKEMQRNWIGCPSARRWISGAGAQRQHPCLHHPARIRCLAPPTWCWRPNIRWWTWSPHPSSDRRCRRIRKRPRAKSDMDRTELAKEKTGVFTGGYAINPVNGKPIPIWIADYVLISYGTGAIMAGIGA